MCTLWLMLYRSCYGSIVPRGETRSPAPTTMNGSRIHANSALRHAALRRSQKGQTRRLAQTNANLEEARFTHHHTQSITQSIFE